MLCNDGDQTDWPVAPYVRRVVLLVQQDHHCILPCFLNLVELKKFVEELSNLTKVNFFEVPVYKQDHFLYIVHPKTLLNLELNLMYVYKNKIYKLRLMFCLCVTSSNEPKTF